MLLVDGVVVFEPVSKVSVVGTVVLIVEVPVAVVPVVVCDDAVSFDSGTAVPHPTKPPYNTATHALRSITSPKHTSLGHNPRSSRSRQRDRKIVIYPPGKEFGQHPAERR